jgi:hypothetical protein
MLRMDGSDRSRRYFSVRGLFLDSVGDDTMRIITLAVGGAILFALTAMDSADAARICKDGHFYYGGGCDRAEMLKAG